MVGSHILFFTADTLCHAGVMQISVDNDYFLVHLCQRNRQVHRNRGLPFCGCRTGHKNDFVITQCADYGITAVPEGLKIAITYHGIGNNNIAVDLLSVLLEGNLRKSTQTMLIELQPDIFTASDGLAHRRIEKNPKNAEGETDRRSVEHMLPCIKCIMGSGWNFGLGENMQINISYNVFSNSGIILDHGLQNVIGCLRIQSGSRDCKHIGTRHR